MDGGGTPSRDVRESPAQGRDGAERESDVLDGDCKRPGRWLFSGAVELGGIEPSRDLSRMSWSIGITPA
jgi:hypothetical protein